MAARWLLLAFLSQNQQREKAQGGNGEGAMPDSLRNFLVEYYVYTATLSMVSIDARVRTECLLGDALATHGQALVQSGYTGSLCGCWLELLLSIPVIFDMGHRFRVGYAEAATASTTDDIVQFAQVHSQIQNWTPPPHISGDSDIALAGRFFQQALLVYLFTALNGLDIGSETTAHIASHPQSLHSRAVRTAVTDGLACLSLIPPTARINTSLCWPIAVVGSCVTRLDQRELLRQRLSTMFEAIGLGNICQTAVLLEHIWTLPAADPWHICQVMQDHQIWISFA